MREYTENDLEGLQIGTMVKYLTVENEINSRVRREEPKFLIGIFMGHTGKTEPLDLFPGEEIATNIYCVCVPGIGNLVTGSSRIFPAKEDNV